MKERERERERERGKLNIILMIHAFYKMCVSVRTVKSENKLTRVIEGNENVFPYFIRFSALSLSLTLTLMSLPMQVNEVTRVSE